MTENVGYDERRGYVETHRADQDGFERVFLVRRLDDDVDSTPMTVGRSW